MQSLIESALAGVSKYATQQQKPSSENTKKFDSKSLISVLGIGGAGSNALDRLCTLGIKSANTVAINTDKQHLDLSKAGKKLLIGKNLTRGFGTGGDPNLGRKCAEQDRRDIEKIIGNSEIVFITAGMGGGTGGGAASTIAEIAHGLGAITVCFVTFPFKMEIGKIEKAIDSIKELRVRADTVIVIDNNKLLEYAPELPINEAFSVSDGIVAKAIKGISDTIALPSLVNIDFADIKAVMGKGDVAVINVGEATGEDKVRGVVHDVLDHPLLDVDYKGATGALLHMWGGPDLTLQEVNDIGHLMTSQVDPSAPVYWGARIQPELRDRVVVTTIFTGVKSPQVLGKEIGVREPKVKEIDEIAYV
jgi:cell division protein FtsZ